MLSIFSCACWPSVCLLWKNVCLGLLHIFWLCCLLFRYGVVWAVFIFWIFIRLGLTADISISQQGWFPLTLAPWLPLALSGDIFVCYIWVGVGGGQCYRHLAREARDAAKHSTILRTMLHPKKISYPKYK